MDALLNKQFGCGAMVTKSKLYYVSMSTTNIYAHAEGELNIFT